MADADFGQVRPAMWVGETAQACSGNPIALWLMGFLASAPGHHSCGIYPLDVDWIAFKWRLAVDQVRAAFGVLEADGYCTLDTKTAEVFVTNMFAIRHPGGMARNPSNARGIAKRLNTCRSSRLRAAWVDRHGASSGIGIDAEGMAIVAGSRASTPGTPRGTPRGWGGGTPPGPKIGPSATPRVDPGGGPGTPQTETETETETDRTDGEDPGSTREAPDPVRPSVRPEVVTPATVPTAPPPSVLPTAPPARVRSGPVALTVWRMGTLEDRVRWLDATPGGDREPALASLVGELRAAVQRAWTGYRSACEDGAGREVDPEAWDAIARAVLWLAEARALSPSDAADRIERLTAWARAVPALTGRDTRAWRWPLVLFGRPIGSTANGRRTGVEARLVEHWNACLEWERAQAPPQAAEPVAAALSYAEERALAERVLDDQGYAAWLRDNPSPAGGAS